ncbi:Short chain dehydrogenase asqE [Fusarium oxysporum f. sp. albedinis]|nr:Short chain dehydrogenase asqE [Fusarium oxysporum f. sp. albedinis]
MTHKPHKPRFPLSSIVNSYYETKKISDDIKLDWPRANDRPLVSRDKGSRATNSREAKVSINRVVKSLMMLKRNYSGMDRYASVTTEPTVMKCSRLVSRRYRTRDNPPQTEALLVDPDG